MEDLLFLWDNSISGQLAFLLVNYDLESYWNWDVDRNAGFSDTFLGERESNFGYDLMSCPGNRPGGKTYNEIVSETLEENELTIGEEFLAETKKKDHKILTPGDRDGDETPREGRESPKNVKKKSGDSERKQKFISNSGKKSKGWSRKFTRG